MMPWDALVESRCGRVVTSAYLWSRSREVVSALIIDSRHPMLIVYRLHHQPSFWTIDEKLGQLPSRSGDHRLRCLFNLRRAGEEISLNTRHCVYVREHRSAAMCTFVAFSDFVDILVYCGQI